MIHQRRRWYNFGLRHHPAERLLIWQWHRKAKALNNLSATSRESMHCSNKFTFIISIIFRPILVGNLRSMSRNWEIPSSKRANFEEQGQLTEEYQSIPRIGVSDKPTDVFHLYCMWAYNGTEYRPKLAMFLRVGWIWRSSSTSRVTSCLLNP